MKKIAIVISIYIIFSCNKNEKKEFYIDKVKKGMTTEEVKDLLGNPIDSSQYQNHAGKDILRYDYNEENFSDYGFNVIFNDSLKVINYYYD